MGGQSSMGGAASPTQATQGTGMQPGGPDLAQLFMNNAPASGGMGGGKQLPQIMAPARQPMPTMPVRTPMPQMQASPASPPGLQQTARQKQVANFSPRHQQWLARRETDNR